MEPIPSLARILKNTREDLDLTQMKVMELTGINHKTLSGYENGVAEPDLQTLAALCRLYRISLDAVLGLRPMPDGLTLTPREKELVALYRRLSDGGQAHLNGLLSEITSS